MEDQFGQASISGKKNQTTYGILAIIVAVLLMALQDAMIKLFATDLTLGQIFTLRSLIAVPVFLGMIWLEKQSHTLLIHTLNRWVMTRSLLLTLMYLTLYAVIPFVPLSILAAGFYTGPIFIVILSTLPIGEPVSRANWVAIFIGFTGLLLSLDLFADSFTILAIVPVLSGLFYALAAIVTRSKCRDHKPLTLALALAMALGVTGIVMSTVLVWL